MLMRSPGCILLRFDLLRFKDHAISQCMNYIVQQRFLPIYLINLQPRTCKSMNTSSHPALESFDFFEALFSNTKQNKVLLLNADGIITGINVAFTTAFGYSDADIIGMHLEELFTQEDREKGVPEKEIKNVLEIGQCNDNNYMVHKNKSIIWVSGESIRVKNDAGDVRILKVIQDIDTQKTSEKSLQNLNEFSERILAAIDDVVVVINDKLNIIKSNRAFTQLFHIADSTKSDNIIDLIKPFDSHNGIVGKIEEAIKTGIPFEATEVEIRTVSGEKRMFDINCRPIESINNEIDLLIVLHDKTIQYQSERQREDIMGFVAHELRNPLANIVLCHELLGEILTDHKMDEPLGYLKRSQNNVSRLTRMISELYDATKVSSGHMRLENAFFNFGEMIEEAVETIKVLHPAYHIRVSGNADIKVFGDRYRMIQVVTNYLSNGIKYSLGSDEVELTMKYDEKMITVSVRDKGPGISKEHLPSIFKRFFRAEKTKNLEGIGLGLYLCKQIITAHNGKVWVESQEGKGSTFYFSVPVAPGVTELNTNKIPRD